MLSIQDYSDSDGSDEEAKRIKHEITAHLKPIPPQKKSTSVGRTIALNAAPQIVTKEDIEVVQNIDPTTKEVTFNPKYEQLFAPQIGPANPFKTNQASSNKNMLTGYAEEENVSAFQFELQRRTFHSYGYAVDPSVDIEGPVNKVIGDEEMSDKAKGLTVFEAAEKRPGDKRKRQKNTDASDIEGYLGSWSKYADEKTIMKPDVEEKAVLDEIVAKRSKRKNRKTEEKPTEEKSTLHIKDPLDYQGRSFLHPPQDVGINLKSDTPPDRCFLPKKHIHTWSGHSKGVSAIRWFPQTAHLLLSSSMDSKIKLWEVFHERRLIRTYLGHKQAVRDICFNNPGTQFLSCGYDRYCKLWDTETGDCISRFTSKKVPYCVKFNPDEGKQHLFVAGTSDKKIVCWDTRSGEIVQEYDRHLGAVNSITFIDQNRRFVSTSDDKSLRVWEWDIPVDFKYIAEPGMHSMPAVTASRNGKWLACQSMDNKIVIFDALNRMKHVRKKVFKGHMVAGYACTPDFSPDMSYVISGDADGKCYIWDWKTTKLFSKFKAHNDVCIGVLWHPHETSKVATCGWDGLIKYWD